MPCPKTAIVIPIFSFIALALLSCGTDSSTDKIVCAPGATQVCRCVGNAEEGVQTCAAGGEFWNVCLCPEAPNDTVEDTQSDTGFDTETSAYTSVDSSTEYDTGTVPDTGTGSNADTQTGTDIGTDRPMDTDTYIDTVTDNAGDTASWLDTTSDETTDPTTDTSTRISVDTHTDTIADSGADTDSFIDTDSVAFPDTDTVVPHSECIDRDVLIRTKQSLSTTAQYTCINGDLTIEDFDGESITLPNLTSIHGKLSVSSNEPFRSLSIPNLVSTGGIEFSTSEVDFDLGNLKTVNGDFDIFIWNSWTTPFALPKLETIWGDAEISTASADNLDRDAFVSLISIGGTLEIFTPYADVTGFNALKTVGGGIHIHNLTDSKNINGFHALESIGGHLWIERNTLLETIDGFDALKTVGSQVRIANHDTLQTITGFGNLESAGDGLWIYLNDMLIALPEFSSMESAESVSVSGMASLKKLSGLESLRSVNGNLSVGSCPKMDSLDAIQNLESVGGSLTITTLEALAVVPDFSNLKSIGSRLRIINNPLLTDLSGFAALEEIGVSLVIYGNTTLTSLAGLEGVSLSLMRLYEETTNYPIEIRDCPMLPYCEICRLFSLQEFSPPSWRIVISNNLADTCSNNVTYNVTDFDDLTCAK
ncbi:MAG: hypothetical protein JXX14_21680 [Deltaproteobacteria bacterium]|nr:hypothetical protein [Deltaproteobacteria bacterium]